MTAPLMPKSTAVWLIENTMLSFDQIAAFTGLHSLEVQALADEEGQKIMGQNPMNHRVLTPEEIKRCEADPAARLHAIASDLPAPKTRAKGPRYTPISKRQDKPDAIAWLLKHHPELGDSVIGRLVGTTRTTINAIRDKTHPNTGNFQPKSPVDIGLCTFTELDKAVQKARKQLEKEGKWKPPVEEKEAEAPKNAGFDFSNFLKNTGTNQ